MIPNQMKVTQVVELESALAGAEKKHEAEKAEGADSLRGLSPPCLPPVSPCLLLSPPWQVLSPTCLPPGEVCLPPVSPPREGTSGCTRNSEPYTLDTKGADRDATELAGSPLNPWRTS